MYGENVTYVLGQPYRTHEGSLWANYGAGSVKPVGTYYRSLNTMVAA
jgi:hypothetical protein